MPAHPLVPLDAEEFGRNLEVLRGSGRLAPSMRFAGVVLAEPPKADVLAWRPGDDVPRRARSIVWDRADGRTASLERGEALFRVRHDARHPFTVAAGERAALVPHGRGHPEAPGVVDYVGDRIAEGEDALNGLT